MIKNFKTYRGDTIVEVLFALSIFSLIAVLAIAVMNLGIAIAESNLELNMARNEVDAQAEAIRFIQSSYLAERELVDKPYEPLWTKIEEIANGNASVVALSEINSCDNFFNDNASKGFVVNARNIDTDPTKVNNTIKTGGDIIKPATLGARLIYSESVSNPDAYDSYDNTLNQDTGINLVRSEGILVLPVKSVSGSSPVADPNNNPQFYDFHIYTCWISPQNNRPTTTGTILRLYNPEFQESSHS